MRARVAVAAAAAACARALDPSDLAIVIITSSPVASERVTPLRDAWMTRARAAGAGVVVVSDAVDEALGAIECPCSAGRRPASARGTGGRGDATDRRRTGRGTAAATTWRRRGDDDAATTWRRRGDDDAATTRRRRRGDDAATTPRRRRDTAAATPRRRRGDDADLWRTVAARTGQDGIPCKTGCAFEVLRREFPGRRWYARVMDDTVVDADALVGAAARTCGGERVAAATSADARRGSGSRRRRPRTPGGERVAAATSADVRGRTGRGGDGSRRRHAAFRAPPQAWHLEALDDAQPTLAGDLATVYYPKPDGYAGEARFRFAWGGAGWALSKPGLDLVVKHLDLYGALAKAMGCDGFNGGLGACDPRPWPLPPTHLNRSIGAPAPGLKLRSAHADDVVFGAYRRPSGTSWSEARRLVSTE